MALVGTLSGSNGTSITAISGSLIIADEPSSRFPALGVGVKLFVSGNKTTLGADTPNTIFGGDAFVSGALGTDSYIQMKPVGSLRIPTNTTASYIYTSGSTNDLYFTQYQPGTGYTNTTRLRWLESVLGTGLLRGGTISTANGTTTFSVLSGSGLIVTQNASITSEPFPTISQISWASVVSQSLTYVSTDQITYITVDSSGAINQSVDPPTISQKESSIYLGRVLHQFGPTTNGTITEPSISYGLSTSTLAFQRAFGPLRLTGHVLEVSQSAGLGTLGLTKTAGESYVEGRNYTSNPNSPNLVLSADDPALTNCKIFREYTDSAGDPVILTNGGAGYSVIDPSQYNNAGTLAAVGNNEWTNQRVYWYPRSVNRALYVYYGSRKYNTFNEAIDGLVTEPFEEGANTAGSAVFVGAITVKGNETNLSSANAQITQAGLFRAAALGGGGGSTAPGGSDTYVQYNDAGIFNGAGEFRFVEGTGTVLAANLFVTGTADGSLVSSGTLRVKDSAGNTVGLISTNGSISGSGNFQAGGNITGSNIAVNGGSITTTAATLVIGGSTTTGSFQGAVQVDGRSTLSSITEKMVPSVGGTGAVSYDLTLANIFYANAPTGDITANFTNVPTNNNRVITPTVILSQSATARIVSAVQIDSSPATINWANGVTPTGTANKQDVFGFSLIRSGSAWKVLGQMSSYG
jgi:hypothetical protein